MRPEVENVLQFVCDSLKAADIPYEAEVSDENPNVVFVCAVDKQGYENVGILGWSEGKGQVYYAAFNPLTANHDEAEGIDADESKSWWEPTSAMMFVQHMNGEVRQIMSEARRELEKA